mgnify:CR=1 FL=1
MYPAEPEVHKYLLDRLTRVTDLDQLYELHYQMITLGKVSVRGRGKAEGWEGGRRVATSVSAHQLRSRQVGAILVTISCIAVITPTAKKCTFAWAPHQWAEREVVEGKWEGRSVFVFANDITHSESMSACRMRCAIPKDQCDPAPHCH